MQELVPAVVAYFPDPQMRQEELPLELAYFPDGQESQVVDPGDSLRFPCSQSIQDSGSEEPAASPNFPGKQPVQERDAAIGAYFPAPHRRHSFAELAPSYPKYVPRSHGAQGSGDEGSISLYFPARQDVHTVAAGPEYLLGSHAKQKFSSS